MSIERTRIAVVDDDARVRDLLARYLGAEGLDVVTVDSAEAFWRDIDLNKVDLLLVDLRLPGVDGRELTKEIRIRSQVPIIVISGRSDTIDTVVCLEIGADDYISKPFELREVLARIRAVLRRAPSSATPAVGLAEDAPVALFRFENLELDTFRRELRVTDGKPIGLTSGEFDLLRVLIENANRPLSREQLLGAVHGRRIMAVDRSIDTQIARLRKKIECSPATPQLIKSVRGIGYVFTARVRRF